MLPPRQLRSGTRFLLHPALVAALGLLAAAFWRMGRGSVLFLGATLGAAVVVWAVRLFTAARVSGRVRAVLDVALLSSVSIGLTLTAVESALALVGRVSPATELTLPTEWRMRPAEVPGAARAYYWHGKLHVMNSSNFRTIGDYVRDDERVRIVVLGDSLTYGFGVAAEDTYSAQLEKLWREAGTPVRVYNLGVSGYQSEDIVGVARKWLPVLQPSRVIYGICLNDFLASGQGQYQCESALQLPMPQALLTRTRLGPLVDDSWNKVLMRAGICRDFYSDILLDFRDYRARFQRDLVDLDRLVREQTGKPTVAMVLDQYPQNERGYRIAKIAEAAALAAGMEVVPTEEYYSLYRDGSVKLHVSRWEGHPNETAHRIFAEMLANALIPGWSVGRSPRARAE